MTAVRAVEVHEPRTFPRAHATTNTQRRDSPRVYPLIPMGGILSSVRTKRASRLAACTAIVLSAGMLLAGTASADSNPAGPHAAVKTPKPAVAPNITLPQIGRAHV